FPPGLIFSALGVITGVWADTFDQHAFVASIVITPLALLGGVFYGARSLGSPWSTLTRLDPLYYLVDATRAGLTGFHESSVCLSSSVTTSEKPIDASSRAGSLRSRNEQTPLLAAASFALRIPTDL